jgi:acetate CoA/acetoacetate CoA-transferase alpha subunit
MTDKLCSPENIRQLFSDGLTVMVGGFGVPGTPFTLVDALLASGAADLTLIKNEANEDHMGVSKLIEAGQVRKIITSHLGLNATVIGIMNRGEIEVEFYPQGILAEKIRSGGAGLFGFLTDIGIDTILREKKQIIMMDGREVIVEPALQADIALIHAAVGDPGGNLVYEKCARNFNPVMATAARMVIAEVERVVPVGSLEPDRIHTPGAFVDHVMAIKQLTQEYGILAHHVI